MQHTVCYILYAACDILYALELIKLFLVIESADKNLEFSIEIRTYPSVSATYYKNLVNENLVSDIEQNILNKWTIISMITPGDMKPTYDADQLCFS